MNGQDFIRVVTQAFAPFLKGLGFSMDTPALRGRLYCVSFSSRQHLVSVSFEPGDERPFVLVFTRENGRLSDIHDRSKTPRLSELNRRYLSAVSREERAANDATFSSVVARDKDEALLLRGAKELRLVLPRYLANQGRLGFTSGEIKLGDSPAAMPR
jgi:hypothetical protein